MKEVDITAYVIADIDITDPVAFEEYRKFAQPTVAAYGGKYLIRGGGCEVLEGVWSPKRLVVLEFESMGQAKQWYGSPEYSKALPMFRKGAIRNLILIEGA